MAYKAVFDYTGDRYIIDMMKSELKEEYMRMYNQFCDVVNGGVIDKLNKKFFKKYPDYKIADDLWSSVEYVDHFRKGYDKVVKQLMIINPHAMTYHIGDELNLIGKLSMLGIDITVTMHIEEEA